MRPAAHRFRPAARRALERPWLRAVALAAILYPLAGLAANVPLRWVQPPGFNPATPDLGLPPLRGVHHEIIYAPRRSAACVEDGGSGQYESPLHGTFNHHTKVVVVGHRIVVYWTNHSVDENGPGQRILARWGVLNARRDAIDWGTPESRIVELLPAPVLVRRRLPLDATGVDRRYTSATLTVVDGGLRLNASLKLSHGWTDDMRFRSPRLRAIPDERFRENIDKKFHFDIFWDLDTRFFQLWGFEDDKIAPLTSVYVEKPPPAQLELTPTRTLQLAPLARPFAAAALLDQAPPALAALFRASPMGPIRIGSYRPHTEHLAENGKNALWHWAEFRRPDGVPVMLHDNRDDLGLFYAAAADQAGIYPPAARTNLYGYGMPAAGSLPDGRVWIIGNTAGRYGFYLTLSEDGFTFDHTWFLLHIDQAWTPGFAKSARSGPQYPQGVIIGDAIWIFYSIGKEQIGATRIPFAALAAAALRGTQNPR